MFKRPLRPKGAMSPLEDFTEGSHLRPVIGDTVEYGNNESVKRVIPRAGQIYYDLGAGRAERKLENDVVIIRVEQLYPFPYDEVRAELAKYPNTKSVAWAQGEPKNQGASYQIRYCLEDVIDESQKLSYTGRPSSAPSAVGYISKHAAQLKQPVKDAMTLQRNTMRRSE